VYFGAAELINPSFRWITEFRTILEFCLTVDLIENKIVKIKMFKNENLG
jgi:hypothetical protein